MSLSVSYSLYCPILQPLGEEGPGETGGCCLATRVASGSIGKAGDAPAPIPTLFGSLFDLSWPSRNLRGMPRAACLIRGKSIEGIFHSEVMWMEAASAPDSTNTLSKGRNQLSGQYSPLLPRASELTHHLPTTSIYLYICLFIQCV